MYHTNDILAKPQELEGAAEPDVRWSTRTNEGVPLKRLSYLTELSTWEEIEKMSSSQTEKWEKAAAEACKQLK